MRTTRQGLTVIALVIILIVVIAVAVVLYRTMGDPDDPAAPAGPTAPAADTLGDWLDSVRTEVDSLEVNLDSQPRPASPGGEPSPAQR